MLTENEQLQQEVDELKRLTGKLQKRLTELQRLNEDSMRFCKKCSTKLDIGYMADENGFVVQTSETYRLR